MLDIAAASGVRKCVCARNVDVKMLSDYIGYPLPQCRAITVAQPVSHLFVQHISSERTYCLTKFKVNFSPGESKIAFIKPLAEMRKRAGLSHSRASTCPIKFRRSGVHAAGVPQLQSR